MIINELDSTSRKDIIILRPTHEANVKITSVVVVLGL
jgi:hypothetical protein